MNPTIIVHGGAKEIPAEERRAHQEGCAAAAEAGWRVLQRGGTALEAVETAIRALEDDPTFNAGFGSELNAAGDAEMDAALMDGAGLQAGAVGAIQGVRNPISAARRVLDSEFVLLVGDGARRFVAEQGAETCAPAEMISQQRQEEWEKKQAESTSGPPSHDTVGCVAFDAGGGLASGTSTGGTGSNPPGRVGDSPLVGCGLYADHLLGACSLTGDGEAITRVVLAKTATDLLRCGRHPDEAAALAIDILRQRTDGEAGIILLDRTGRIGWSHNAANMACAYRTSGMDAPAAFLEKSAERREETARDGR